MSFDAQASPGLGLRYPHGIGPLLHARTTTRLPNGREATASLRECEALGRHLGDGLADTDRGRGSWRWDVEHVYHALGLDDVEIVQERPIRRHCLGTNPRPRRVHILHAQLRYQLLQG